MDKLKFYLKINSLFSGFSALILVLFHPFIAQKFNISSSLILILIGIVLFIFSITVAIVAIKFLGIKMLVRIISLLDLAWVLGSFTILFFQLFNLSTIAYVVILIVALWISFLAYQQLKNSK